MMKNDIFLHYKINFQISGATGSISFVDLARFIRSELLASETTVVWQLSCTYRHGGIAAAPIDNE
jgi:hypothetical protein